MTPISKERLLLVEGKDEEGFFGGLCCKEGFSNIQIIPYQGRDNLGNFLKTLVSLPRFEKVQSLGITRDADEDSAAAYQSVLTSLTKAGLPRPEDTAVKGANPETVVIILPPSRREGCLETVLWETIKTTSTADCIRDYVACTEIPEGNRRAKAMVHTYLARMNKPGLKIGEATLAGYWDLSHIALNSLKTFLSKLAA